MATTVVIADDRQTVSTGFRTILESRPDIEVLAAVAEGETALADVAEHQPEILPVTRRHSGQDKPRIVIVTTFDLDEYVHAALHGGASGFLLKDARAAMPVEAVRAAAVGGSLVPLAVTVRLLRETAPRNGRPGRPTPGRAPHPTRTGRRTPPRARAHQRPRTRARCSSRCPR